MNNQSRAAKIRNILRKHYEATDLRASLRDLLADARHFADRQNFDFADEDRRARDNYGDEVWEADPVNAKPAGRL